MIALPLELARVFIYFSHFYLHLFWDGDDFSGNLLYLLFLGWDFANVSATLRIFLGLQKFAVFMLYNHNLCLLLVNFQELEGTYLLVSY